jgi:hypothetical protein
VLQRLVHALRRFLHEPGRVVIQVNGLRRRQRVCQHLFPTGGQLPNMELVWFQTVRGAVAKHELSWEDHSAFAIRHSTLAGPLRSQPTGHEPPGVGRVGS